MASELPKKVALKWREWSNHPEFEAGLQWLQRNHAPRAEGRSDGEVLKGALSWDGYMTAIDDVVGKLTQLPKREESIDDPGLKPTAPSVGDDD